MAQNYLEHQIFSLQTSIAWHKDRGLNSKSLEHDLEILLKKTLSN